MKFISIFYLIYLIKQLKACEIKSLTTAVENTLFTKPLDILLPLQSNSESEMYNLILTLGTEVKKILKLGMPAYRR
jgi:hypothetical protein